MAKGFNNQINSGQHLCTFGGTTHVAPAIYFSFHPSGQTVTTAFLYKNGTFKVLPVPNTPTDSVFVAVGISARRGLILIINWLLRGGLHGNVQLKGERLALKVGAQSDRLHSIVKTETQEQQATPV